MKNTLMSIVAGALLALFIGWGAVQAGAAVANAGLFYKPLPTYESLQHKYNDTTDAMKAHAEYLLQKYGKDEISFNACADAAKEDFVKVRAEYVDWYITLEYFRQYPEESVADHFESQKKDYEQHANDAYLKFEKCMVTREAGQREAAGPQTQPENQ